jgi:adenosylcobinamide amidohydrolase
MRVFLTEDERFLEVDFGTPMRTLSWALVGGGFGVHERVVWHLVGRGELPLAVDPGALLESRLAQAGFSRALGFLTARALGPYVDTSADAHGVAARAIVTVGLGNALTAGDPASRDRVGTINVLAIVSSPLTDAAMVEALALVAEARTAAVLAHRVPSVVSGRPATGTGTDCIAIACPAGATQEAYAGKHTYVGAAIGRAVYEATDRATQRWLESVRGSPVGSDDP